MLLSLLSWITTLLLVFTREWDYVLSECSLLKCGSSTLLHQVQE